MSDEARSCAVGCMHRARRCAARTISAPNGLVHASVARYGPSADIGSERPLHLNGAVSRAALCGFRTTAALFSGSQQAANSLAAARRYVFSSHGERATCTGPVSCCNQDRLLYCTAPPYHDNPRLRTQRYIVRCYLQRALLWRWGAPWVEATRKCDDA